MSRRCIWSAFGFVVIGFFIGWLVAEGPLFDRGGSHGDRTVGLDSPPAVAAPMACPDVYTRYVGLHEGKVAVFAGQPDGCRLVLSVQPWTAADLPRFVQDDLQRGIPFERDEELFQIFDGLTSP